MIRFNIVGTGFLDSTGGVSFRSRSQWFRFADIQLGRTTEFSVPANAYNRELLGYADVPEDTGEAMRRTYDCQMVYDGGMADGLLEVRSVSSGAFRCVFYFGMTKTLESLLGLPLSKCVTTLGGVQWDKTPTKANLADPSTPVDVILYECGVSETPMPAVNVKAFCEDILTGLGCANSISIDPEMWMVSASLFGGTGDTVTFSQTATNSASVTQVRNYFEVVDIDLEWAKSLVFGVGIGGGTVASKGFRVRANCSVTFTGPVAPALYLVKWQSELVQCATLGGVNSRGVGDDHTPTGQRSRPLDGLTIQFKKGDVFFFAHNEFLHIAGQIWYGYKDNMHPLSVTADVTASQGLNAGETWYLRDNMPDMTVFEFLRSVALATGCELTVASSGGVPDVRLAPASYGSALVNLERIVSVDEVSRKVGCWGDGTRTVRVRFAVPYGVTTKNGESDYGRIEGFYEIDNDQLDGEKVKTSKLSDGRPGNKFDNLLLLGVSSAARTGGSIPWTVGLCGSQSSGMQMRRINVPDFVGYADIASSSTCVRIKVHMNEADFLGIAHGTVFARYGSLYVWTEADWSDGVASLELQKVSELLEMP